MYVYIFDFGDQIKIGQANNVNARLRTLEMQSGRKILQQFSIEADGKYEMLMHKRLVDYRGMGEYFDYPYEEAVFLLRDFVEKKILDKKPESVLEFQMDFYDRVQILVKEITDKPLKDFIESLNINYNDYNADRQLEKLPRANESVKIAQSLGVTVEYLVTGIKPEKPDIAPVIQKLESALEEIRRLDS
jgi:hypothetical protein